MNEYEIAFSVSGVIFSLCIFAYISSWVCQWIWAWIDDSTFNRCNALAKKVRIGKWIYPIYNSYSTDFEEDKRRGKIFGYAKDKKNEDINLSSSGLKHGTDYKYTFEALSGYWTFSILATLMPIVLLAAFKIYPITLAIILFIALAHLSRFTIRHKKLFDKHVNNKDAHSESGE